MIIREGRLDSPIGIYENAVMRQVSVEVQIAQEVAEIQNLAEYRARKKANLLFACTPEEIAKRQAEYHETFAKATESGLRLKKKIRAELGLPEDDPPLPDPLPLEMKGQSESTIRAMLRHDKWEWDKTSQKWNQK